jgi:hypothetical protein
VIEDMLNRTLTREYLDVVKAILYGGGIDSGMGMDDETEVKVVQQQTEVVSELGIKALQCDATCHAITLCLLK